MATKNQKQKPKKKSEGFFTGIFSTLGRGADSVDKSMGTTTKKPKKKR